MSDRKRVPEPVDRGQPTALRAAALLVALEAAGLFAAMAVLLVKTATGSPHDAVGALSGALLALAGAALLALAARGLLRRNAAYRTPVVVLQLLALPVSYSLAFQAGRVGYGGPILILAVGTLVLLFLPPVRAVLERDLPGR